MPKKIRKVNGADTHNRLLSLKEQLLLLDVVRSALLRGLLWASKLQ